MIPAATLALVAGLALAGTRFVPPDASPWSRFWGTLFFALLLWPLGLTLVGRLFGRRAQLGAAGVIVALTAAQQLGLGSLPLPLVVRWSVSLAQPGDAVRRELTLPPPTDRAWERAWSTATRAAIAVCTEERVPESVGITVSINDGPPIPLAPLDRTGADASVGWYAVPITRSQADARRPLTVTLRRTAAAGPPARICGGQDDPTRPGWGGSARLAGGQWVTDQLADLPLPPIAGRPAPSRYYIELRLFDARGLPHAGIWY